MTEFDLIEEKLRRNGWEMTVHGIHGFIFENYHGREVMIQKEGQEIFISCFSHSFTGTVVRQISYDEMKLFMEVCEYLKGKK